ncbi:MAG: aminoglycoside nucleotidyltransferase [Candidatus Saccharibacteria bacterium]
MTKEDTPETEMTVNDIVGFLKLCDENEVEVWVDGGWGVDALLGEQTRKHGDLDIAIEQRHTSTLESALATTGYKRIKRDQERPHNFVLGDETGHQIDVHVVELDEVGNGIYGPPENGEKYPASSLTGEGKIGNLAVKCISPEDMIIFHTQYEPDEGDYHDVKLLCDKFNIPLPEIYKKFEVSK